jgi:LacI family transcriptional regulator
MKRVTITDVANLAGVSKSTVSHVLNQTRFVEESTRRKVVTAIENLGYRPSNIARSLVSKRTKTAGLLISDVGNPFYHEVIRGVEEIALAHGYSVFLCNTRYDLNLGMEFIHSLIEKSVDGILFMSSSMSLEMIEEVVQNQIQAVVLDWGNPQVEKLATSIRINFAEGICQAVNYLVELGHTHIAHVSGPSDLWTAQVRKDIFLSALRENRLDTCQALVIEGNLRIDGGRRAFEQLIHASPRPTAVFAANDLTALGIVWAARNYGLNIPEQLSIIGLDDIELASEVNPALTTVALPRNEIGRMAMELLLDLITNPDKTGDQQHEVSTKLTIRQSTARPASL